MPTGLTDLVSTRTESYHRQVLPATLTDILHERRKQSNNASEKTPCEILATAPILGAALSARMREISTPEGRKTSPQIRDKAQPITRLYANEASKDPSQPMPRKSMAEIVETYTSALPPNIVRIIEYHRKKGIARQEAFLRETLSPVRPESSHNRLASIQSTPEASPRSTSGRPKSAKRRNLKQAAATQSFKCVAAEATPLAQESLQIVRPSTAPTMRSAGRSKSCTADEAAKRTPREESPVSPTRLQIKLAEKASKAGLLALRRSLEAKQKAQRARLTKAVANEFSSLKKRRPLSEIEHREQTRYEEDSPEPTVELARDGMHNDRIPTRRTVLQQAPSSPTQRVRSAEPVAMRRSFRSPRLIVPQQRAGIDLVVPEKALIKSRKSAKLASEVVVVPSAPNPKYYNGWSRFVDPTITELEQAQVKVISWTSQRDGARHAAANLARADPGTIWESTAPPDQSLVFDIGSERDVCGLVLRCSGTKADPKDVIIMRGLTRDGPWVIVRRIFVNAGSKNRETQKHEFLFDSGGESRFWKLLIKENWGASGHVSIVAPLTFLARPLPEEKDTDDIGVALDVPKLKENFGLEMFFSEALTLSIEDQEVRLVARKHDIPLHDAERIRDEFRRYTSAGRTLNYWGFSKLLHAMVTRSAAGCHTTKYDDTVDIPESRVWHMWNEIDQDHGYIDFENFLLWFYHMFYRSPLFSESQHSGRGATTLTERFYDGLGRGRIRKYLQKMEYLDEPAVEEEQEC